MFLREEGVGSSNLPTPTSFIINNQLLNLLILLSLSMDFLFSTTVVPKWRIIDEIPLIFKASISR